MTVFLRGLLHPSVWLLLLCAGLSLLLGRETRARGEAEARNRTLLRAYAETVRQSGPPIPAPEAAPAFDSLAQR